MGRDYRIHIRTGMVEVGDWAPWPFPKKVLRGFLGYTLGFIAYGWSLARYSPRKTRRRVLDEGGDPSKYAFPSRLTMAHLAKTMAHSKWMPIRWEPIYQWLARQDISSSILGAEQLLPRVAAAAERSRQRRVDWERKRTPVVARTPGHDRV